MMRRSPPPDPLVFAFSFSHRSDGGVSDWTADNAVGVLISDDFAVAKDQLIANLAPLRGYALRWQDDPTKSLRAHLLCNDVIIGVLTGWRLTELAGGRNVLVKQGSELQ